jgi:hypothetical protein
MSLGIKRPSAQPVRWTVGRAAAEFGVDRKTLDRRIVDAGVKPSTEDDCYSTAQIIAAVFGDLDAEKLRKMRAEADLAEMERDERARSLLAAEVVSAVWLDALTGLRAVVMAADVPKTTRAQLLKQLRDIPLNGYEKTPAPDDADIEEGA